MRPRFGERAVDNVWTYLSLCAQDVPARYWRIHGVEGFDGITYTLAGPLSPWSVKTATNTWGKQTFCSFTEGWAGFCASNRLKVGDSLKFTKIGPVEFEVMKVWSVEVDVAESWLQQWSGLRGCYVMNFWRHVKLQRRSRRFATHSALAISVLDPTSST